MSKSTIKYLNKEHYFHHFGNNDHISKALIKGEWYELPMLEYIHKNAPKGGLYVDVGAYIGTHSVFFASYCADSVIAFEPNSESFDLLKLNTASLPVSCLRLGVGFGIGIFEAPKNNRGNSRFKPTGKGGLLADREYITGMLKGHNVNLIKVDVEGMQDDVFEAFLPTIKRCRPWIAIECNKEQVQAYLSNLNNYHLVRWFGATPLALLKPMS